MLPDQGVSSRVDADGDAPLPTDAEAASDTDGATTAGGIAAPRSPRPLLSLAVFLTECTGGHGGGELRFLAMSEMDEAVAAIGGTCACADIAPRIGRAVLWDRRLRHSAAPPRGTWGRYALACAARYEPLALSEEAQGAGADELSGVNAAGDIVVAAAAAPAPDPALQPPPVAADAAAAAAVAAATAAAADATGAPPTDGVRAVYSYSSQWWADHSPCETMATLAVVASVRKGRSSRHPNMKMRGARAT